MRLTRKHKIIIAVTSVFILVNILLIYFDTEQKVSKTSHVKEWTSVGEKDMYESIDTKGVLDFSEESFVYFDDNLGEFQSFRSEEHTSELQSRFDLVCRLLLEKKKKKK